MASCVEELRQNPELSTIGDAAMYGLAAKLPSKGIVGDAIMIIMESVLDI